MLAHALPCHSTHTEKMPGHWLLAQMGKRVLRPGGLELTHKLLAELAISATDDVVEFAPGLGVTARLTLARQPRTYTAIERDRDAAAVVESYLQGPQQRCVLGSAEATGLGRLLGQRRLRRGDALDATARAPSRESSPKPRGCSNRAAATASTSCASCRTMSTNRFATRFSATCRTKFTSASAH